MVVLVWGKKLKSKYLGLVADFCPICRDIKACKLSKLNLVDHVYYIPISQGDNIVYRTVCNECGYDTDTDFNKYTTTLNNRNKEINNLIQHTFPLIRHYYKDRLNLEYRLQHGKLNTEERLKLIIEPFLLMEKVVLQEIPANTTHLDAWDGLVITIAIIAFFIGSFFISTETTILPALVMFTISLSAFIFLLISAFQEKTAKRLVKKKIFPKLIKALKDINPSLQELKECLNNRLSATVYRISNLIEINQLYQKIQQYKNPY